jgi:type II secretory pathway pseudopilin PulG
MNRSMNKRRRRGMTILEVLFAIMITTIGLLGAIAVFPVASEYARKGRLNDELAVCAESAVHKFDAQYMRRPDRWVRYFYNSNNSSYSLVPGAAAGESYCIDPRFYAQNLIPNPNMPPNNFPNPIPGDPQATVFPSYPQPNLTGVPANVGPPPDGASHFVEQQSFQSFADGPIPGRFDLQFRGPAYL